MEKPEPIKEVAAPVKETATPVKETAAPVSTAKEEVVDKIIFANPDSVTDYKNGHDRAIKFLMGQVMKETHGGVNPSIAMSILKDKLDK